MAKTIPTLAREVISSLIQTGATSLTLALLLELEGPAAIGAISRFVSINPKATTVGELYRKFGEEYWIGSNPAQKSERQKMLISGIAGSIGSIETLEWLRDQDMLIPLWAVNGACLSQQYQVVTWIRAVEPTAGLGRFDSWAWTINWTPTTTIDSEVTDPTIIAANAALHGKMDQLNLSSVADLNLVLEWAVTGGHMETIRIVAEHGNNEVPVDWARALLRAAQMGNFDALEYILDRRTDSLNFTDAIGNAKTFEIAKFLIQRNGLGPHEDKLLMLDFNRILQGAIARGNLELVNWSFENGALDFPHNLYLAVNMGHLEIVELLIARGANDFDEAFVRLGDWRYPIGRYLFDNQPYLEPEKSIAMATFLFPRLKPETRLQTLNTTLIRASGDGIKHMVDLVLKFGANAYDLALIQASRRSQIKIIRRLIAAGATDLENAIKSAMTESASIATVRCLLDQDLVWRTANPDYVGVNFQSQIIAAEIVQAVPGFGFYGSDRSDFIHTLREYSNRIPIK